MRRSAKILQFLPLGFFLRLWLEKLAERRLRVARNNQALLTWATFAPFLFRLVSHVLDGKLYLSLLGFEKVRRTGLEPVRLDSATRLQIGPVYHFPAPAHKGAKCGARGWLNTLLASAWFAHLSGALYPSSFLLTLRSLTRFCISAKYRNHRFKHCHVRLRQVLRVLNEPSFNEGNCLAFAIAWNCVRRAWRRSGVRVLVFLLSFGLARLLVFRLSGARSGLRNMLRNRNAAILLRFDVKANSLCQHLPRGHPCISKLFLQIWQRSSLYIKVTQNRLIRVGHKVKQHAFIFRLVFRQSINELLELRLQRLIGIHKTKKLESTGEGAELAAGNIIENVAVNARRNSRINEPFNRILESRVCPVWQQLLKLRHRFTIVLPKKLATV